MIEGSLKIFIGTAFLRGCNYNNEAGYHVCIKAKSIKDIQPGKYSLSTSGDLEIFTRNKNKFMKLLFLFKNAFLHLFFDPEILEYEDEDHEDYVDEEDINFNPPYLDRGLTTK